MAAAVLKGIIISISIITALGIAVLENPQIQVWLEEQRRKIAELLRSLGEELDPESRRQAEAFAFEGRTPATDEGLRREASGSREATALATGRSLSGSGSTIRRIPVRGPSDPDEAEARRRKGREYLAKRNAQMFEMQQRRKTFPQLEGIETPTTPTSFNALVDEDGKLKEGTDPEIMKDLLPSTPAIDPVPEKVRQDMREVERQLVQPLLAGEASSSSLCAFQRGSQLADPFGDEYALERSETPRPPPVPPKISHDSEMNDASAMPVAYARGPAESSTQPQVNSEELSYEEQLAIALSLSEAESSANTATVRQRRPDDDDSDLAAAIAASLRDMDTQQAAHAIAHAEPVTPQPTSEHTYQPLVDLSPPTPCLAPQRVSLTRSNWEELFDHQYSPSQAPQEEPARSETTEDLYSVTPQLTRARLASLDAQNALPESSISVPSTPYDPVREELQLHLAQPLEQALQQQRTQQQRSSQPTAMEASFYSAPSSVSQSPSMMQTTEHEQPQLIEVEDTRDDAHTPIIRGNGFHSDSDSETFASMSRPTTRSQSRALSEVSGIEVVDVVDDSEVDMLSEEGDGVLTPDSWTEVGSRDGESEMSEDDRLSPAHMALSPHHAF